MKSVYTCQKSHYITGQLPASLQLWTQTSQQKHNQARTRSHCTVSILHIPTGLSVILWDILKSSTSLFQSKENVGAIYQ